MDQNDRQAIAGLFDKLSQAERQSPYRDAEAERFIAGEIARQPGAPYYMAQTIVVQDHALTNAQARIEALEGELQAARQGSAQGGGFFGRLFGGQPGPQNRMPVQQAPQGGGFLAGAAQTAMGVAGGMMLANALGGMFAGPAEAGTGEPSEDPGFEDPGLDDMGDW